MCEKPVVFVIGSSGTVGVATLTSLSENHSDKVRIKAGVRDPHSDKAKKLKDLSNVTIVQATMGDSGLAQTFAGVSTLFIVTPPGDDKAKLVSATADSAKQAGVGHIAVVSAGLADFPESIMGKTYNDIESFIPSLGIPYTFIRVPAFLTTLFYHRTIASMNFFSHAASADNPLPYASAEDIGKTSAVILVDPKKYAEQTFYITTCVVSQNDLAKALSVGLGREIKYVQVSFKTLAENMKMPENIQKGVKEVIELENSGHLCLRGDPTVVKRITGEDPMTLEEWVQKYRSVFTA